MRVAVFVDGANFFFLQRDGLGWFADPRKILTYLARYGEVVDAYYYIGQQTQSDPRQQGYLDALPSMGYTVVTKPIKNIYDAQSGGYRRKANLDIEIVVDMFNTIDQYDMAILISGDGDFERALQLVREKLSDRYYIGFLHGRLYRPGDPQCRRRPLCGFGHPARRD